MRNEEEAPQASFSITHPMPPSLSRKALTTQAYAT